MKKIALLILVLGMVSCTPLKPDGQFGKSEFVGKFYNSSIYRVHTPHGNLLYLAVNDNYEVVSTQSTDKAPPTVIYVNGKKVEKDEALKLLQE